MSKSQFLVKVHDLINKPGQMREYELDFELAEQFGEGSAFVAKGAKLELDLRLESVHEGILATGDIFTTAKSECSRCLDALKLDVEVDFQELFAYSGTSEDDLLVQDDSIDLDPVIRDAVVLSLPFTPVCSPDCAGLCAECGVKLADNPGHAHEAAIDSRWSELQKFETKED
ncbi:MAG: YceD family protein [Micrococcales bacterium]